MQNCPLTDIEQTKLIRFLSREYHVLVRCCHGVCRV